MLTGLLDSVAASLQSAIGGVVPAGGWFAHLQSAAMGGNGVPVVETGVRSATLLVGLLIKMIEAKDPTAYVFDPWANVYGHM